MSSQSSLTSSVDVFSPTLFRGRTCVITGGGTGIGLSIARQLLLCGIETAVLASRNKETLTKTQSELKLEFPSQRIVIESFDLKSPKSIESLFVSLRSIHRLERIDYLVNCGGGQFPSPLESLSPNGFSTVVSVNLIGTFLATQKAFTHYFKEQNFGCVVSILMDFYNGFPGLGHSAAARSAMENLTKTTAIEWSKHGCRLNCVAPGIVATEGLNKYPKDMWESIVSYRGHNYAHRFATPSEIAASVLFLLSPAANFITGQTIAVDGGESIYSPLLKPEPLTSNDTAFKPWGGQKSGSDNSPNTNEGRDSSLVSMFSKCLSSVEAVEDSIGRRPYDPAIRSMM